jgi:hypothetical protein
MCGATQVDRAFLKWLDTVLEPLDICAGDLGTGGHFTLKPIGRIMLQRFEIIKHSFDGSTGGNLNLPRRARALESDEAKERVKQGILKMTS